MVMTPPPAIASDKLTLINDLYLNKKYCVREVAEYLKVSPDTVLYFIRKHKIPRRSYKESQQVKYERKPLTFDKQKLRTPYLKELAAIGIMLYWAEGYKGDDSNHTVDFANSDPLMIELFLKFFRSVYKPNESKLRVQLYCYSNQDVPGIIKFWSNLANIPVKYFTKPYVRSDFREDGRKMKYGLAHIRYYDKKLLLDIKSMIQSYVKKYA